MTTTPRLLLDAEKLETLLNKIQHVAVVIGQQQTVDCVHAIRQSLQAGELAPSTPPVGGLMPCPMVEPLLLYLAEQISQAESMQAAERLAGNNYHEHGWARERVAFQIVRDWVNEWKSTRPTSQWIPVEERLPPEFHAVWAYHECDLYPVTAYWIRDNSEIATGGLVKYDKIIWLYATEGPEDVHCVEHRHSPLYRNPTHWKEIDKQLPHIAHPSDPLPPPPTQPMHISPEWLKKRIESDPDAAEVEAGILHPEAPRPGEEAL